MAYKWFDEIRIIGRTDDQTEIGFFLKGKLVRVSVYTNSLEDILNARMIEWTLYDAIGFNDG